jgi:S1-C subfamily serine protease
MVGLTAEGKRGMVDKEVEDYVKVQRGLGVGDAEIRKSLLDAGYDDADFDNLFTKPQKKAGMRTDFRPELITTKHVFYLCIIIIVALGSLSTYLAYDYNAKIEKLSADQEKSMDELSAKMVAQSDALRTDVSSQLSLLGSDVAAARTSITSLSSDLTSSIQNYNYQSLVRDNALSESVQKMSNRSLTELSSFQQQLNKVSEASTDFAPIIPKAQDSVVTIGRKDKGVFITVGSGVLINNVGYIVTNEHVIDALSSIYVRTHDNNEYAATVIGKDESWDVAVIKLTTEKSTFTYLNWADSDRVFVGQHIIAVGNPVGLESTVTEGIISNTNRLVTGDARDIYYLQTDVAINAGNSGGPLIDKEGKIVGIATMKYMKLGYEGLSFALRSNDVQGVVMDILQEEQK